MFRSGLDRCLRRHGVGNLRDLTPRPEKAAHKPFKAYESGFVHIDVKYLPQMADEKARRYLFVAIDRATRWVFIDIEPNKTAAAAQAFLHALHKACPIRITKILTDNGKEFTKRLRGSKDRDPTGAHKFDRLCDALGIEHRLTRPRRPQTNGMVERFTWNRPCGAMCIYTTTRCRGPSIGGQTPMQAMIKWLQTKPNLFIRRPYDRAGLDN